MPASLYCQEVTPRKKVAFQVQPSEPLIVIITGTDGRKYECALRVAVIEVTDTGLIQEADPTIPMFEFKAQMIAETKVAGE